MPLLILPAVPMAFAPALDEAPRVREVQFDDGYKARSPIGLNWLTQTWRVPWTSRTRTEADILMAFFRGHRGIVPFLWTPPGEAAARRFVCPRWSRTQVDGRADLFDISAEFEEDHGLATN